ncbi:hybrid sensor histidine kinase/response regulator [Chitinophaga qingshengii]|uniref:histidine kinase n=1 Tax=Chitinophaga qingshengii TaxID=1569794 RepID=A0ABR7TTD6_9BACT|nr:hybrid sensor histidine kinase/response regulator [Chitinophaga qingshengii]MBC9932920.1 response regulator [Chitinophaga qingshengii]
MKAITVFPRSLTHLGTSNFNEKELNFRVIKINIVAWILIILGTGFGMTYWYYSRYPGILVATLLGSVLFGGVLYLNKKRKYQAAGVTLQSTINLSTLYFGSILSAAVDPIWLALFLLISCLSFVKVGRAQIWCLGVSAATLLFLEINRALHIFPPMPFSPEMLNLIYYCTAFTVLTLTSISLVTLVHYNAKLFHTINLRNQQLTALNKELHASNTRLEHQVKERTANLEKAVTAKNIYVRELTHELRTPLNAIYSIAQLKLLSNRDKAQADKKVDEDLFIACRNLQTLINNTQDKCKLDTGNVDEVKKESVLLYSWITNIVNIYQYFANEKRVKIELEVQDSFPTAIVEDSIKLTKIVNNILVNAIKFTRNHTSIFLRIYRDDTHWYIAVRDQGNGISPDRIATLFKEFTRTTINFAEGSGLGLNITHHLVRILGGTIQVRSEIDEGTEFVVSLPLVPFTGEIKSATIELRENNLISFEGKKILVVEDDIMTQRYLSLLLSKRGFSIMHADNGQEALLKAHNHPDAIILDMSLPGKSGKDVLMELKSNPALRHIPVIAASADTDETNIEEIMLEGASAYMIKPIDFHILIDVLVKNLLTGTLVRN